VLIMYSSANSQPVAETRAVQKADMATKLFKHLVGAPLGRLA
jgi:hypothetical protein